MYLCIVSNHKVSEIPIYVNLRDFIKMRNNEDIFSSVNNIKLCIHALFQIIKFQKYLFM